MVVLEVSQITLRNWSIRDDTNADIYLEVYFERKVGSCSCCGRERRKHVRDRLLSLRTTDKVCEAGEMMWRKYNEDNFLVGLFRLEGTSWRSLRSGEVVTIVVDVRRVPRGATVPPGESGELMQVMKAPLMLGTWGLLTLRPVDRQGGDPSADEADLPVVTMELRPRTMRPFMLEFAKPDFHLAGDADFLGRRKRLSLISQDSFLTFSGGSTGSQSAQKLPLNPRGPQPQRQNPGNLANFSPKSSTDVAPRERDKTSFRRGLERLCQGDFPPRKLSLSWSERHSSDPPSSQNRNRRSGNGSQENDKGVSAWSPAGSFKGSDHAHSSASSEQALSDAQREDVGILRMMAMGMSEEGGSQQLERHRREEVASRGRAGSRDNSKGSKYRDISQRLRGLVRRHLKSLNDKRQRESPKEYTQWTPENWETFWQSCWPKDDDQLGEGHDVVPLMEAEFRKDCVIFFNTLFPRSQSGMFQILKKLAFDPGGSKASFRQLSDTRQPDIMTRMSSIDLGSIFDPGEDERRNLEDCSLGYRLTCQAVEAARTVQRRLSRSKSSLATSNSAENDAGGIRSRTSLWSRLFPQRDSRSSGSSKAASPTTSRSQASEDMRIGGTGSNGSNEGAENEDGNADNYSVASLSMPLPAEDLGIDTEVPRPMEPRRLSTDFLNFQNLVKQQPCMCTVTTPKGVFVDEYTPRIMLLKRVLLCFAICGIHYTEVSNCSQLAELWPYPLASVLGHGSRVLIRLEDVEASEFINFLMFGDPLCVDWKEHGLPYPLVRRLAATHTVQLDADTGNLVERKLQVMRASDTMQNISDGIKRKHLGLNVPIGGVGNPSPVGREHFIDFTGRVVQRVPASERGGSSFMLGFRSRADTEGSTEGSSSPRRHRKKPMSDRDRDGTGRGDGNSPVGSGVQSVDLQRPEEESSPPMRHRSSLISTTSINLAEEAGPPMRPRLSMMSRASLGSLMSTNEVDVTDDQCSMTSASLPLPQAKQRRNRMRLLNNIQGGHLYIRIDDFGEQMSRGGNAEGGGAFGRRSETRRLLLKKPRGYNLIYEQAKLQARLSAGCMDCGELFFSNRVPEIKRRRAARMHRDHCGGMTLLRMCSEPSFDTMGLSATDKDIEWVKEAMDSTSKWPLKVPPSPMALHLALDHFDPTNMQLYGQGGFKSIEDFWRELRAQRSFLVRAGPGLQRYVEPLVLQLRWKGYTLMSTHEVYEDSTGVSRTVPRYSFISASMRPDEHWEEVLDRVMASEFHVSTSGFHSSLKEGSEAGTHTILEETLDSFSYPGMSSYYRAHMVVCEIKDEGAGSLSELGLPFDTVARDEQYQRQEKVRFDFSTSRRSKRKRFYSWVPERMSRELQGFLNMDMQTGDDRWAKYAFESQGVVQYPPTEEALTTLLKRCGIDVSAYGRNNHRSVGYFWLELLNQESYLMMNAGRPHRIVESLFVKVRWKQHRRAQSKSHHSAGNMSADGQMVLVKRMETDWRDSILTEGGHDGSLQPEDSNGLTFSLLNTRKYREETWEDCMMRCVMKELALTKQQLKSVYERQTDEDGRYAFHDLVRQSKSFPGILTLYRTHLVTINLKEDYASLLGYAAFNTQEEAANRRLSCNLPAPPVAEVRSPSKRAAASLDIRRMSSSDRSPSPTRSRSGRDITFASHSFTDVVRESRGDEGRTRKTTFLWVNEDGSGQMSLEAVSGAELWVEARKREEKHKVASVLIGLEGTAPQRKSPFGVEHDASGTSAKVSATGGRKWRAYGRNNALQIPSDHGGMHLKITRPMFQEFMDTCEVLNLVDPGEDLVDEDHVYSRGDLERRYAEKELFKNILAGNGRQANEAVELMKEYCSQLRTPNQAYNAISKSRSSTTTQEPVVIPARVTVAPESGDIINV